MEQVLIKDLSVYKNFNEFFYRKLTPEARAPEEPENSARITSSADSRCVVFPTSEVTTYWIKVCIPFFFLGGEFLLTKRAMNLLSAG
jgi:phosphatidylserine decarboxylase